MELKELHQLFLRSAGISTDTRNIKKETIFFALKGENYNANLFAEEALEAGASYAVVDQKISEDPRLLLVPVVLECLQELATFHRRYCGATILALTGSNGKTTTKELINSCLSQKYRTVATSGNLNNHIGVPLTLLNLTPETEIGIIEMGANHAKEIAFLSQIAEPDFGYITNFGKAHLEGFKSPEGVIAAKSELYDYLRSSGKLLFLNIDDPVQRQQTTYPKTFRFGSSEGADIHITFPPADPFAAIVVNDHKITSNLIGEYNSRNIAAAFSIGSYFEVPVADLENAIASYTPQNNRSQILERNNLRIIMDAYNANPTSMAAALDNLENLQSAHKIAVLGDMFELGNYALTEHQNLAERLENSSVDEIYVIGKNFYATQTGPRIRRFKTYEEFKTEFDPKRLKKATILVKGSRGMALERILEIL